MCREASGRPVGEGEPSGLSCPSCEEPLDGERLADGPQLCARCGTSFQAARFHPVVRRAAVREERLSSGDGPRDATRERDYLGLAWLFAVAGILFCPVGVLGGVLCACCSFRALRQMREWGDAGGRLRVVAALTAGLLSFSLGLLAAARFLR